MDIKTDIKTVIANNQNQNKLYLRNLLKEVLQNYVLNFVYNSNYNDLIFTGGTCLRKVYGLNRVSEDLDFDYKNNFDIEAFSVAVTKYMISSLKISNTTIKITNNQNTMFIKIPVDELVTEGIGVIESKILFLRCDFSKVVSNKIMTEVNAISTDNFTFFVKSYDLPTLFTNKIVAFLERSFYKGKEQKFPFKGRDVYDLMWFLNLSASTSYSLKPNKELLLERTKMKNISQVSSLVIDRLNTLDTKYLEEDLLPLLESSNLLEQFLQNYEDIIKKQVKYVF